MVDFNIDDLSNCYRQYYLSKVLDYRSIYINFQYNGGWCDVYFYQNYIFVYIYQIIWVIKYI